jgi:hypothetical protein
VNQESGGNDLMRLRPEKWIWRIMQTLRAFDVVGLERRWSIGHPKGFCSTFMFHKGMTSDGAGVCWDGFGEIRMAREISAVVAKHARIGFSGFGTAVEGVGGHCRQRSIRWARFGRRLRWEMGAKLEPRGVCHGDAWIVCRGTTKIPDFGCSGLWHNLRNLQRESFEGNVERGAA